MTALTLKRGHLTPLDRGNREHLVSSKIRSLTKGAKPLLAVFSVLILGACSYFSSEEAAIREYQALIVEGKLEQAHRVAKRFILSADPAPGNRFVEQYLSDFANEENCADDAILFSDVYRGLELENLPDRFVELATTCWSRLSDRALINYRNVEGSRLLRTFSYQEKMLASLPQSLLMADDFFPNPDLVAKDEIVWLGEGLNEVAPRLLALQLLKLRLGYAFEDQTLKYEPLSAEDAFELIKGTSEKTDLLDFISNWEASTILLEVSVQSGYGIFSFPKAESIYGETRAPASLSTAGRCITLAHSAPREFYWKVERNAAASEQLKRQVEECASTYLTYLLRVRDRTSYILGDSFLREATQSCKDNIFCGGFFKDGLVGSDLDQWIAQKVSFALGPGGLADDFFVNVTQESWQEANETGEALEYLVITFGDLLVGRAKDVAGGILLWLGEAKFQLSKGDNLLEGVKTKIAYMGRSMPFQSEEDAQTVQEEVEKLEQFAKEFEVMSVSQELNALLDAAWEARKDDRVDEAIDLARKAVKLSLIEGVSDDDIFNSRVALGRFLLSFNIGSESLEREGEELLQALAKKFPFATINDRLIVNHIEWVNKEKEKRVLAERAAESFDAKDWISSEVQYLEAAEFCVKNQAIFGDSINGVTGELFYNAAMAAKNRKEYGRARSHLIKASKYPAYAREITLQLDEISKACPNPYLGC